MSVPVIGGEDNVCWVCLDGDGDLLPGASSPEQLQLLCKCPRPVHPSCLARWQLQSAGQDEESKCRFCHAPLPDWRSTLTPSELPRTTKAPVMAINVDGKEHKLRVRPGPEGREAFKRDVKRLLGFPDDADLNVIFECKAPNTDDIVQLQGFAAFDAAAHCASVAAARRQARHAARHRRRAQQLAKQQQEAAAAALASMGMSADAASSSSALLGHQGSAAQDPMAAQEALAANLVPLLGVAGLESQASGLSAFSSSDSTGSLTSSGSLGSADYSAVLSAAPAVQAASGAQEAAAKPCLAAAEGCGQGAQCSAGSSKAQRGVQQWQQAQEQGRQARQQRAEVSSAPGGASARGGGKVAEVARRWMEALLPQLSL